ncbi:ABC transporter permease [Oricola sp.]|uniref:ABC transporter permease n=1 Tax=Oricola sp. TaxID=1979950 RepID=UPI0025DBEB69|nr:ABC transporter permease [Oricola sp.]MCI5075240.1 ABC transporter permease [Oricola sp.]
MALRYIGRRLALLIPVTLLATLIVFLMVRLLPGGPAGILAGEEATIEEIAALEEELGLNEPIPLQYVAWLGRLVSGDLGESIFSQLPVFDLLMQRVEPTISLAILSLCLTIVIAVPMGCLTGAMQGARTDRFFVAFTGVLISLPVFLVGYLLIYSLSLKMQWFPVQGYVSIQDGPVDFLRHLALPAVAVTLHSIAFMSRITRVSMIEQLARDFVRTARAKGAPEFRVITRHALRNAAPAIIAVIGLAFLNLINGVIIVETVFSLPGIGRLLVGAISNRDFPVLQGILILFVMINLVVNILLDILYVVLDPRTAAK